MGWHIITSFVIVDKTAIIFRDKVIDKGFKILSYTWVSIFIYCQPCRSVLDENMQYSNLDFLQFWEFLFDPICNQVKASGIGFKSDSFLKSFHLP